MRLLRFFTIAILLLAGAVAINDEARAETGSAQLLELVRSGEAIAMMRHALAPGGGDPSGFVIGDCSTQRNLSEEGREQARQIGSVFRAAGISDARVMTSQWCRCRETAELLDSGKVEDLALLNSFFSNRERGGPQTDELRNWLQSLEGDWPVILVTHQVNITALTGVFPKSGETVVFTIGPDGLAEVLGSFLAAAP